MWVKRYDTLRKAWVEVARTSLVTMFEDSYHYVCYDMGSAVVPGATLQYRLGYFNDSGDGPSSATISIPVLPSYSLNLSAPSQGALLTDTTPTFAWSATAVAGADRYDLIRVYDQSTGTAQFYSSYFMTNLSSVTPTTPLPVSANYYWTIQSFAYVETSTHVWSYSYPSANGTANNGTFTFGLVNP